MQLTHEEQNNGYKVVCLIARYKYVVHNKRVCLTEVSLFRVAGHDTTSSALTWILYCLGEYPEEQSKVREDVLNVLGDREEIEWSV